MSKQNFVEGLRKENSTFSTQRQAEMVANLLDTVSSDIYSESQRFVFELIQNADDAAIDKGNVIHFDFLSNSLIVSHNGKPFDENDIISLTGVGDSTKKADPTKTGYKGIGFKSVFGKSERVTIFSGGYQFRFDKSIHKIKMPWQVIPIWTELRDLTQDIQNSISATRYQVSTIIEIKNPSSLLSELKELLRDGQILLFLRRSAKISVASQGKVISSFEKKVNNISEAYDEVSLHKDEKETSSWITKTFEDISISDETKQVLKQDEKTPDKLKDASFTEISFAAKIEEGKIRPLKKEDSLIFTYLPTKVSDFEFPFLINGSFLTNAAREGLHEDRIWNQWLFKLTAEKILDWLEILTPGKFKFQILQLLPPKFGNTTNELKNSFNESLERSAKGKAFVPSKSLKLKKPSEIIVDKTGLADLTFISPEVVIAFINEKENTNLNAESFVNSHLQRTDKLRPFGTRFFDSENLESFFLSAIFKNNHQPSENFALIEYFYNKATNDESREWNEKLKAIPFIFAKGNNLKSPKAVCFPSVAFATEFGEGVTVIHSEVYSKIENNSRIKNWLQQLGVKEPSDTAYLENEIIGNIENCIDIDNYLRVTRYIFNQHKKGLLTDWHYEQLQDLKIFTTGKELKAAKECYLSDFYQPSLKLEKVNEAGKYVSESYKQSEDLISEWKTLFLKIGISENISTIRVHANIQKRLGIEKDYFNEVGEAAAQGHRYPHLVGPSNTVILDKIRFSQFASDYKFSKLFWDQAIKTISPSTIHQNAWMPWGFYGSQTAVTNYFYWSIENSKIFPSTTKECLQAKNLYVNDKEIEEIAGNYLPVFDYDEPLPEEWRKLLPFKSELELIDYLSILTNITKQSEEDEGVRKYNLKRIGLIYNKLASLLPNFSKDKKQVISKWATGNKLLATNGKFENASDLKWIKIEGFATKSETLKAIQIPTNCEIQLRTFEELISLFQVQIVNKFIPVFENEKKDVDLSRKLRKVIPYFAGIIEKRKYTEYAKEYERLFLVAKRTEFYSVSSIKLSFTHKSETIEAATLNVFRESNKVVFKGKWRNPITMFNLIPELSGLLDVTGLNDELRLLLELPEPEIIEWLTGIGYDISALRTKAESVRAKQLTEVEPSKNLQAADETLTEISESTEEYEIHESEEWETENFDPIASPLEIDTSKVLVRKKSFTSGNQVADSNYSEIQSQEVREDVGRWSEEFVFQLLNKNENNFSEIIWVNKEDESGSPYDFKVIENGKEKYIDVKGTPSSGKAVVYLSQPEWKFMLDAGENYSIYRVYSAGQNSARVEIIENPSQLLIQGKIFPNPITLEL